MNDRDSATAVASRTNGPEPAPRALNLGDRVQSLRLPASPKQGSSGGLGWVPWVLCALFMTSTIALGGLLATGWTWKPATSGSVESTTSDSSSSPSTSRRSEPAAGEVLLESKGYIIPAHQILVSPKVSGMIVKLHFDKLREGQRVPAGAPLAEIEDVEYRAEAERARANFSVATERWRELKTGSRPEEITESWNQWKEAERQVELLKTNFDRNQKLRATNVLSPQEFDQSKSDLDMAEKRVRRLEATWKMIKEGPRAERIAAAAAEMQLAKADLGKAEWRLSNCIIRAPASGTILKKNAEEGNIVNPVAFNGSFSLCEMADLSDLEVDLSIQERDVSRVFALQRCRIEAVDAFPGRHYEGYVSRLMPIADRAKGAVPVRVKIRIPSNEEGVYLKPEMGAIVRFLNAKVDPTKPAPAPESGHSAAESAQEAAEAEVPSVE